MKPTSLLKQGRLQWFSLFLLIIALNTTEISAQCTPGSGTITLPAAITNWNVVTTHTKSYIVPNGGTLNVTATQNMTTNVSITVMVGGVININSGGMLRGCGTNSYWQGIVINGNNTVAQSPSSAQGKMTMTSSTIKDAILAAKVFGGGILQCTNASFIDNREDVYMLPYNIAPTSQATSNISRFYGTSFSWTKLFPWF
jgi:hypothetical protein